MLFVKVAANSLLVAHLLGSKIREEPLKKKRDNSKNKITKNSAQSDIKS